MAKPSRVEKKPRRPKAEPSPVTLYCEACKKRFAADHVYLMLIAVLRRQRVRWGRLTCAKCGSNLDFDRQTMTLKKPEPIPDPGHLMCPVSGCWGFAMKAKRGKAFACVDCGGRWADEPALFASIARIVARYRHRRRVYRKTKDGWVPTPADEQPDDWQDRVARERTEDPP